MKEDKKEEGKYGCNVCGDTFQDLKSLKFHDATKHKSAVRVSRGPKKIEVKKILSQESCHSGEASSKKRKVAPHPESDLCGVCRTSLSASAKCPLCDEWGHENLLGDTDGGKSRHEEDSSPERRISLVRSNIRLNNIVGVLRNQVLGDNDVVPHLSAQLKAGNSPISRIRVVRKSVSIIRDLEDQMNISAIENNSKVSRTLREGKSPSSSRDYESSIGKYLKTGGDKVQVQVKHSDVGKLKDMDKEQSRTHKYKEATKIHGSKERGTRDNFRGFEEDSNINLSLKKANDHTHKKSDDKGEGKKRDRGHRRRRKGHPHGTDKAPNYIRYMDMETEGSKNDVSHKSSTEHRSYSTKKHKHDKHDNNRDKGDYTNSKTEAEASRVQMKDEKLTKDAKKHKRRHKDKDKGNKCETERQGTTTAFNLNENRLSIEEEKMLRRIFEGEDSMEEVKNVEEESTGPSGKGGNDEDVGDFNFPEPVLA